MLSGKGGVGKSSITAQLALSLCLQGFSVGILDADLTGPSIPHFLDIENAKIKQDVNGWLPVLVHPAKSIESIPNGDSGRSKVLATTAESGDADAANEHKTTTIGSLKALSLALLLPSRETAIIWRGPKKTSMIRQLLSSVQWDDLDYLLIDTPPGTSDEHISLAETLLSSVSTNASSTMQEMHPNVRGAVVVTTPQAIATADVRKELNFCRKTGIRVLGVVENMAGYSCPCCGKVSPIFGRGGGEAMAREWGERFLGTVPIDTSWGGLIERYRARDMDSDDLDEDMTYTSEKSDKPSEELTSSEAKKPLVERYQTSSLYPIFSKIAQDLVTYIEEITKAPALA